MPPWHCSASLPALPNNIRIGRACALASTAAKRCFREVGGEGHVAYPLVGDTVNTGSRLRVLPLPGACSWAQRPTDNFRTALWSRRGLDRGSKAETMFSMHTSCSHFPSPPTWWSARGLGVPRPRLTGSFIAEKILATFYRYMSEEYDPDRADLDSDALRRLRETEQTSKSRIEVMRRATGASLSGGCLGPWIATFARMGAIGGGPRSWSVNSGLDSSTAHRRNGQRWCGTGFGTTDSVATFRAHNHPDADTRDRISCY